MKVERRAASGGRMRMQRKIDGTKSNEDREEGVTVQLFFLCSKSQYNKRKDYICVLKNHSRNNDHVKSKRNEHSTVEDKNMINVTNINKLYIYIQYICNAAQSHSKS